MNRKQITIVLFAGVSVFLFAVMGRYFLMNTDNINQKLRVAFPVAKKSTDYEPTNISLGYEYIFLENVFSPLVEVTKDGQIEAGVAEKIEWVGDDLKLTIRDNLKTISGIPITASDVVFSLKRLLVLSGNTHGNFKDIVCPEVEIKSVEDECRGIHQDGNAVYLNAKGRKSFLLPMLAAIDFAIIPKSSVDPATLKITNYSETSGVYSVISDDGQGHIELEINPHHYFASKDIPQKITLVPIDSSKPENSLNALLKGDVDHLTTIDAAKSENLIKFANEQSGRSDFDVHVTMKIRNRVLVFTERGYKELSLGERRYIGEKVKQVFTGLIDNGSTFEQRSEFFPHLSEGGLTDDQLKQFNQVKSQDLIAPKTKFKLGLIKRGTVDEWATPLNKVLPQADCYIETVPPDFKKNLKFDEMPHAFIASTDTGFMEDIGLISYSLNAGLLGQATADRTQWMADYMAIDDKTVRIKKLKDLHYKALSEAWVVPVMASPYAAIIRKPWRLELSDLYANNQLWRIKHH
jgi:MarR-like DNA-binding transcriptional regulator SgrR of sgrS sRNA